MSGQNFLYESISHSPETFKSLYTADVTFLTELLIHCEINSKPVKGCDFLKKEYKLTYGLVANACTMVYVLELFLTLLSLSIRRFLLNLLIVLNPAPRIEP